MSLYADMNDNALHAAHEANVSRVADLTAARDHEQLSPDACKEILAMGSEYSRRTGTELLWPAWLIFHEPLAPGEFDRILDQAAQEHDQWIADHPDEHRRLREKFDRYVEAAKLRDE